MSRCRRCGYDYLDLLFKPTCFGNGCLRGICDRCAEEYCCQKCEEVFLCGGNCFEKDSYGTAYVDSVFCSFCRARDDWICVDCCDQLKVCDGCWERFHSKDQMSKCQKCPKKYCHQCLESADWRDSFCQVCRKYCDEHCPDLCFSEYGKQYHRDNPKLVICSKCDLILHLDDYYDGYCKNCLDSDNRICHSCRSPEELKNCLTTDEENLFLNLQLLKDS